MQNHLLEVAIGMLHEVLLEAKGAGGIDPALLGRMQDVIHEWHLRHWPCTWCGEGVGHAVDPPVCDPCGEKADIGGERVRLTRDRRF